MSTATEVQVYGRPGCHLCDDAIESLGQIMRGLDVVEIREIDIESDDLLFRRYLEKIPVVMVGGQVVAELESDAAVLRRLLASSGLVEPLRDGYAEGQ